MGTNTWANVAHQRCLTLSDDYGRSWKLLRPKKPKGSIFQVCGNLFFPPKERKLIDYAWIPVFRLVKYYHSYVCCITFEKSIIDLNRLPWYRALEFRQPVTQGKHSVKRSLYKALLKRLSLVLRRWRPARTISYRPFLKHQRFAVWSL